MLLITQHIHQHMTPVKSTGCQKHPTGHQGWSRTRFCPHLWPSMGTDCCAEDPQDPPAQDLLKSRQNLCCPEGTTSHLCHSSHPGTRMGRGISLLPPLWELMRQCGRQGWKLNFQMTTFERQVRKGYLVSSAALSDEKPKCKAVS